MRDKFVEYLRNQARWRAMKADEYPEDARNAASSFALYRLADHVARLPEDDPRLIRMDAQDWPDLDVFAPGERAGAIIGRVGFSSRPLPLDALDRELDDIAEAVEKDAVEWMIDDAQLDDDPESDGP